MFKIFRLLPIVTAEEEQNLIWSYILNHIAKLLETEDDTTGKIKQILEMFIMLDDTHQNNVKLAIDVIKKFN